MSRFLTRGLFKGCPSFTRFSPAPPDPQFDEKVQDICDCYLNAIERDEQRERTISMDDPDGHSSREENLCKSGQPLNTPFVDCGKQLFR